MTELRNFYKRRRIWRSAILAVPFICCASSLLAQAGQASQTSSPQANQAALAQIKILTDRVAMLEQKLAKFDQRLTIDEASSTNNPQTATPVGGEEPTTGTSAASGGLSKSDQDLLAKMQKQIDQLENANKDEGGLVSHPNNAHVVTAPFKVVDSNGVEILDVEGGAGTFRGLRVYTKNDSFAQLGTSDAAGYANIAVHLPGDQSPRIAMGILGSGRPVFAIRNSSGVLTSEVTEVNGGGQAAFTNPAGLTVALIGDDPKNAEGHAQLMDPGGTIKVDLGPVGTHGDIVLYGNGKSIPVWAFMLLGFH